MFPCVAGVAQIVLLTTMKNRPSIGKVKPRGQAMTLERMKRDWMLIFGMKAIMMCIVYLFPVVVKVYLSSFVCMRYHDAAGGTVRFMAADGGVDCDSNAYKHIWVLAIISICVIVPASLSVTVVNLLPVCTGFTSPRHATTRPRELAYPFLTQSSPHFRFGA